jgi:enterochelin esterase-like enzyme
VVQADLRITNGGHDWDVWEPAFVDGLKLLF